MRIKVDDKAGCRTEEPQGALLAPVPQRALPRPSGAGALQLCSICFQKHFDWFNGFIPIAMIGAL